MISQMVRNECIRFTIQFIEATYNAHIKRIRVVTMAKGARFYIGIIRQLLFNPSRWHWATGSPLMSYSARLGRSLLNPRQRLTKSIPKKWHGILPMSYQPWWLDIWNKNRPQKEADFLWSILHYAVATNCWRAYMAPGIPVSYLRCQAGLDETILHRFHHYARTQSAYHFALTVLYTYLGISHMNGAWPAFAWQQWLLGSTLPWRLQKGRHL
jgi:hypothetical protein